MRIARSTGRLSGAAIVLLGIWGALIPFVGPYFDYSFGVNSSWHYTSDRLWLSILPGVVAVLAGVVLFFATTRVSGILGGWLAILAGAWFAVGPAVSLTWEHGQGPIGPPLFGTTRQALELIGYFYGVGALIVALGAFAVGRFSARPGVAAEEAIARAARTEPLARAEPGPAAPRRRRLRLPRRRGAGAAREDRPVAR